MSFSATVKEEMVAITDASACCRLPGLAGMTLACGAMHLTGGGVQAEISTESPGIARWVFKQIKALYGVSPRIEQHERHRLNRNFSYRVVVEQDAEARRMLTDIGVLGASDGDVSLAIRPELVRRSCCATSFIRGLFLGCGSMSDPEKAYHLEMVVGDEQLAHAVAALLEGADVHARVMQRRGRFVIYIKEADHISQFLALTGAHAQMLRFEGIRVEKGVRNNVNRVVNCDTANVEKTVRAAARQVESIRRILQARGLDWLPDSLRQAAEVRLNNPDATLERLAEMLGGVSKSGLNHRFRRLEEIATECKPREETADEL